MKKIAEEINEYKKCPYYLIIKNSKGTVSMLAERLRVMAEELIKDYNENKYNSKEELNEKLRNLLVAGKNAI